MHAQVRQWIVKALEERSRVVELAVRQRAKFEGWLKLELADRAVSAGASDVLLESADGNGRADVSFMAAERRYLVELKTANANWRIPGIIARGRPITRNINGIIADGKKLALSNNIGIVAFVLFPVPAGDVRWLVYLDRISEALHIDLDEQSHASRVRLDLNPGACEVIVCAFVAPNH